MVGKEAIKTFFTSFFANFKTILETVHTELINGNHASTHKQFSAVLGNGCLISLPVIQNFVLSSDGETFDSITGVWDASLFGVQAQC